MREAKREPLIHISKRGGLSWRRAWGVRAAAIVLALLTCVIGVLLVLRPEMGARMLTMMMGVSLFMDGVLNLSVALCTVKIVRHQQPDVIDVEYYEVGKDE